MRSRARSEAGFSVVELLVVVLIVGILAAIAIPAYLGQTARAQDAEAKAVVSSLHGAIKVYAVQNGDYSGADVPKLMVIEPTLNDYSGEVAVTAASNDHFSVEVASRSGNAFTLAETDGVQKRTCTTPGSAGCHSVGDW